MFVVGTLTAGSVPGRKARAIAVVGQLPAFCSATLLHDDLILSMLVGARPIPAMENFAVGHTFVRHRLLARELILLITLSLIALLAAQSAWEYSGGSSAPCSRVGAKVPGAKCCRSFDATLCHLVLHRFGCPRRARHHFRFGLTVSL